MRPDGSAAPRYTYVTEWWLDAPPAAVWAALTDVERWPGWWPFVRRVQTLRRGDARGVGAVRRITWGSRLPYGFTLDVECTEADPERSLRGVARGDLQGVGWWQLRPEGTGTAVRYTWQLDVNARWMRWVAPLASPVFRWNHEGVMRAGLAGLRQELAGAATQPGPARRVSERPGSPTAPRPAA